MLLLVFDPKNFWSKIFFWSKFFFDPYSFTQKMFQPKNLLDHLFKINFGPTFSITKQFFGYNFFGIKTVFDQTFFLWIKKTFWTQNFMEPKFFKIFWNFFALFLLDSKFFDPKNFWTKIFFGRKKFGSISRAEIKIAHFLPEQSAYRENDFLQYWALLNGTLDKKKIPLQRSWGDDHLTLGAAQAPLT